MDDRIVKIIVLFGWRYWTESGVRTKSDFLKKASHWRPALAYFLEGYAFERLGGFNTYVKASLSALEKYKQESPGSDFEDKMWRSFCDEVKKRNPKVNPLTPNEDGRTTSVSQLICDIPSHNIIKWTHDQIASGRARAAYDKIHSIRGIGDKITSFFMRDVAIAYNIQASFLQPEKCFQPIDVWTERGAKALAVLLDNKKEPQKSSEYRDAIVRVCEAAGLDDTAPLLVNTGLWYMGASTNLDPDDFDRCLEDYGRLREIIRLWLNKAESDAKYYKELLEA